MRSVGELLRDAMQRRPPLTPEGRAAAEARYAAELEAAHRAAEAKREDTFGLHLARCGAPGRVCRDAASGALQPTKAIEAAKAWMGSDLGHLVLAGFTGTGKSVAAAWTLRSALRVAAWGHFGELEWDSSAALWLPFGALLRMSDYEANDRALFARACRVRLLVLDDVGLGDAAELAPHEKRRLELLADARDTPGLRTVWTTNKSLRRGDDGHSELGRYLGQRVYSRIARSVQAVDCGNTDLRRVKP